MQLGGLYDLVNAFSQGARTHHVVGSGSCSALIKLLPNNKDIFISQVTWDDYSSMLRVYKLYDLQLVNNSNSGKIIKWCTWSIVILKMTMLLLMFQLFMLLHNSTVFLLILEDFTAEMTSTCLAVDWYWKTVYRNQHLLFLLLLILYYFIVKKENFFEILSKRQ